MRKIRFRYIKENGKSTSVTVRCSLKRNASLISEALRHYQRLERQNDDEITTRYLDKQTQRQCETVKECKIRPIVLEQNLNHEIKTTTNNHHYRYFDPIQLRRKQCSSTLIDEEFPQVENENLKYEPLSSSSSSGFRSNSQTSSMCDENDSSKEILIKRTNIIKEIYKSEYDYIGHLKNLIHIYLKQMRLRSDLFDDKQIHLIMGNIEEIFRMHEKFYRLLKLSIDEQNPHESLIGKCFLLFKEDFKKYSTYCINHPLACLELIKLENNNLYRTFFESCRLQANMIDLKFDAFLLTPIQRICQYPLQLNQLLKSTPYEHKDYNNVDQALNAMREVATYINEQKRRMEYVEIIHKWQNTVEGWQGKNLLETSTQGLGRSEVNLYHNGKKESVILFLFDHVLIICKKDRRNNLTYIGRADLDNTDIEDLIDGKIICIDDENYFHCSYSWCLYDRKENKSYIFSHRTPLEKVQMMDALEYERAYVEENRTNGLELSLYQRIKTLKTQEYLANQSLLTTKSFSSTPKANRSASTALYSNNSRCTQQFLLPRFVRCSSPDSLINESFHSIKSHFRCCS